MLIGKTKGIGRGDIQERKLEDTLVKEKRTRSRRTQQAGKKTRQGRRGGVLLLEVRVTMHEDKDEEEDMDTKQNLDTQW